MLKKIVSVCMCWEVGTGSRRPDSAPFQKGIHKNVVSYISFYEASEVRKLHVGTEDNIRSNYLQVCMLSMRMMSK